MQTINTRAVVAGAIGNALEWYDFAVYGYFAPVIAAHFFPTGDPVTALIATFGVFAAGFLMRPIGGLVIGHIGDRLGRKAALTLSVALMAIPTSLISVLPTYAAIGLAAPVLLTLLRLLQGLSVGGEYTGSVTFLIERAPPGRRGVVASAGLASAVLGVLLASATGALVETVLTEAQVHAWGWRVPFALGLLVGIVDFYIRRHITEEAPARAHGEEAPPRAPILTAVRDHRGAMARVAAMGILAGVAFYMIFVYAATWLTDVVHVEARAVLDVNTAAMAVLVALIPAAAWLSDRVGRRPVMLAGAAVWSCCRTRCSR